MDRLDEKKIAYDVCPGVSSFCGAASSLHAELTLPGVSQSVIITRMAGRTGVPERESFRSLAAHHATMAVFLSTGLLSQMEKELAEVGYESDTPAVIIYKATWPEEKIVRCTVSTLAKSAEEHGIQKGDGHMKKLTVVGMGPGEYESMTLRAVKALNTCDVIVGYTVYVDLAKPYFPDKEFLTTPMKREIERCEMAFAEAEKGRSTRRWRSR